MLLLAFLDRAPRICAKMLLWMKFSPLGKKKCQRQMKQTMIVRQKNSCHGSWNEWLGKTCICTESHRHECDVLSRPLGSGAFTRQVVGWNRTITMVYVWKTGVVIFVSLGVYCTALLTWNRTFPLPSGIPVEWAYDRSSTWCSPKYSRHYTVRMDNIHWLFTRPHNCTRLYTTLVSAGHSMVFPGKVYYTNSGGMSPSNSVNNEMSGRLNGWLW